MWCLEETTRKNRFGPLITIDLNGGTESILFNSYVARSVPVFPTSTNRRRNSILRLAVNIDRARASGCHLQATRAASPVIGSGGADQAGCNVGSGYSASNPRAEEICRVAA